MGRLRTTDGKDNFEKPPGYYAALLYAEYLREWKVQANGVLARIKLVQAIKNQIMTAEVLENLIISQEILLFKLP